MNTEMNVETEVILLCVPVSSACSQKMGIKYSESIFLLCLKKKNSNKAKHRSHWRNYNNNQPTDPCHICQQRPKSLSLLFFLYQLRVRVCVCCACAHFLIIIRGFICLCKDRLHFHF